MEYIADRWFAVVNPHAGSGKTASAWKRAETLFPEKGILCDYTETDCKLHATEITFNAAADGYRRFIAVGGDGTIHEVLDGIMHYVEAALLRGLEVSLSDFYLAVIPIGSGNDWVKEHGIPHDVEAVMDLIASGSFSGQDIVKVSVLSLSDSDNVLTANPVRCSYMMNIGGIGLDAMICERVNKKKDKGESGKFLYVNALIYSLINRVPIPMRVLCDGEVIFEGDGLSIAFGIGRYSGGGMRQTPDAIYNDGLLDVTVIPYLPLPKILYEAPKLFNGRLGSVKEIVRGRSKTVSVVPLCRDNAGPAEVDGEVVGTVPIRFDVLPDQINVLHNYGE